MTAPGRAASDPAARNKRTTGRKQTVAVNPVDGRERILIAAERLIAERGINVALRDIAIAAGQLNNSAVQYYFGSRDGLIEAVIAYRTPLVEQRRLERLAQLEHDGLADDPRALVAALVEPMLDARVLDGVRYHSRFLEQVRAHPSLADPASILVEGRASVRLVIARLGRVLPALPKDVRAWRLQAFGSVMLALLADHERAVEADALTRHQEAVARQGIVDAMVAILLRPASQP